MFDANCLRRVANWSSLEKEHKFDKESFNPKKMLEDLPLASPKLLALLNNIKEQDEQDMRQHGKTFKHFIFSEVKAGGYGGRVIVGGLIASGFQLCYDEKLRMKDSAQLLANSGNTFGFLCSTTVYEQPLGVGVKKEMLQTFNSRPSNIHGEIIRIMVADGGFKEGIDLFDVKYVHIFEPQTSEADMKQAVGRATRKCGQSGLQFQPNVGWTLHVYVYDVAIPERLKGNLQDAETLFDLYLKNTNIDLKKITFAKQLEQAVIFGAVDYPLNKNIIDLRGDVVGLSGGLNRNGKKPIPPKLGNEVICNQSCSINRPSKYVPVSIPLFASVAIVVHAPLPPKKMKKPRTHFCDLLKTNKAFCTTVQKAFLDQRGFIKRHANTLLDAIENGVHNQMNYSTRANVLKYIYSFANSSIQQKMVQSPNVKRMLIADRRVSMRPDATNGGVPNAQLNTNINNGNVVESTSDALERPRSRGGVNSKNTNADANANAIVNANAVLNANSLQTRSNSQKTNSKNSMLEVEQQDEHANVVPRKTSRRHTTPNATNQDTVLEELATIPLFSLKAPFKETRDYIVDTYASFAWPKVELENMCAPKTGGNIINRLARASVMLPLDPPEDEPISAANALLKEMEAQVKESDENQLKALNNGVNKSIVATFTPTQEFVRHYLTPQNPYKGMLLYHSVGTGKCHAKNTPILMFDGSIKMVQDIKVGDLLMGDNSTPRTVLSLARGTDEMYDIVPNKGDKYTVNSEHILVLKYNSIGITNNAKRQPNVPFRVDYFDNKTVSKKAKSFKTLEEANVFLQQYQNDEKRIVEIEVKDFLKLAPSMQKELKGIRTGVEFEDIYVVLNPYLVGLWLGDGSSRGTKFTTADKEILEYITNEVAKFELKVIHEKNYDYRISGNGKVGNNFVLNALRQYNLINNKHIPHDYLVNSKEKRLQLLAGIIDTDGHYDKNGCGYEITQKSDTLANGILFLARSLGFAAYSKKCKKSCIYNDVRKEGIYNRIYISGDVTEIPVKLPHKKANVRQHVKDVLTTGIKVESVGVGEYYGFTLDGNNRYLLGDFTITHNTCTAIATATSSFEKEGWTILWVTRTTLKDDIWKNMFDTVCSLSIKEKLEKGTKIPQNLTDKLKLLPKNWSIRPMSYKQFTNLVAGNNKSLEDLIKKNGAEDPLRKTLLIIDEAHKLYGGSDLLPAEKPDMRKLKAALHKSYTLSGKESVKLLLMSATPYTNDPMELIKLVNLMKEPEEQLPTDFDEFNQVFLDENTGAFTAEGKELFLEKVNGMISFLDRGNDAREFAQPVVSLVAVPLSQRPVADLMALKEEHDKSVASLKHIIKQLDDSFMIFKNTKLEQVKDEIKEVCGNLKGQQYLDCKNKSTPYVQVLLNSIDDMATRINEIKTTHSTEIKKIMTDFNRLKEINENNISQEHIITSKCISTK